MPTGLIAAYERAGSTFAATMKSAEPDLFTFLWFKDVEPTNNAAIKAVRQRRCREQLKTNGGMQIFSVLLTCLETWGKKNMSIEEGKNPGPMICRSAAAAIRMKGTSSPRG